VSARGLAVLLVLAAAVGGCASGRTARITPDGPCLPAGRSLVMARVASEDNRAIGEAAAEQLVNALRGVAHVSTVREFSAEASTLGLAPWAADAVSRLERGGRLTREEGQVFWDRFGIGALVIADVAVYEQVWGKYGKFTRAGLDAQAVDLVADRMLWRRNGVAEVEDKRGRAFQVVLDRAVQGLADSICPMPKSFSVVEAWRNRRR
jgi:hypothetical protein